MRRVAVMLGMLVPCRACDAAEQVSAPACELCGDSFCVDLKPDYRVTGSRPAASVIAYRVEGPEFRLTIEEGARSALLALHANDNGACPGAVQASLTLCGNTDVDTTNQIRVKCEGKNPDVCRAVVGQIKKRARMPTARIAATPTSPAAPAPNRH